MRVALGVNITGTAGFIGYHVVQRRLEDFAAVEAVFA